MSYDISYRMLADFGTMQRIAKLVTLSHREGMEASPFYFSDDKMAAVGVKAACFVAGSLSSPLSCLDSSLLLPEKFKCKLKINLYITNSYCQYLIKRVRLFLDGLLKVKNLENSRFLQSFSKNFPLPSNDYARS